MKYIVTLNGKNYEVLVEKGEAILESVTDAPVVVAAAPAAPAPAPAAAKKRRSRRPPGRLWSCCGKNKRV